MVVDRALEARCHLFIANRAEDSGGRNAHVVRWQAPDHGTMKINTDRAFVHETFIGAARAMRCSDGSFCVQHLHDGYLYGIGIASRSGGTIGWNSFNPQRNSRPHYSETDRMCLVGWLNLAWFPGAKLDLFGCLYMGWGLASWSQPYTLRVHLGEL